EKTRLPLLPLEEEISLRRLVDTVIRRFLRDRDVVDVALAPAGARDPDEPRLRAQLGDVAAAGIAHRRAKPADQLVDDRDDAALVRHAALDALRDELLQLL